MGIEPTRPTPNPKPNPYSLVSNAAGARLNDGVIDKFTAIFTIGDNEDLTTNYYEKVYCPRVAKDIENIQLKEGLTKNQIINYVKYVSSKLHNDA